MLVKDIELVPSIIDLVDNAVDGMRRLADESPGEPLWVRLQLSGTSFRIQDNCGGIPVNIARDYAFRFGRPAQSPTTAHSVGQFGVGMKRALFKIGGQFLVESRTANEAFTVDVDVDEWRDEADGPWHFRFKKLEENLPTAPLPKRGTAITVTKLHPSVSADFATESFRARLATDLQQQQQVAISRGLAISVNGIPVNADLVRFVEASDLRPALAELSFNGSTAPVDVELYAGVAESDPREAGWYIFCNGRLIVAADRTPLTGWDWGRTIPRYHNQFARFRGYAFFDSDDSSLLPWTTTKTNVDENSPVYRAARLKMIELMRPVIDFLNVLDKEREGRPANDPGPLAVAVLQARQVTVEEATLAPTFVRPERPAAPRLPRTGRIQYDKLVEDIDRAKRSLGVTTYKEVGERTFEYYLRMEADE